MSDPSTVPTSENVVAAAFRSLVYYLTPAQRREGVGMLLLLLLASLLDVVGLASLVPIIMAASRPGSVVGNRYSGWAYHQFAFSSEKQFLVVVILLVFVFFLAKNLFSAWINLQQTRFTARVALGMIDSQFVKHTQLPFWKFQGLGTAQLMNDTVVVPNAYVNGVIRQLFVLVAEVLVVAIVTGGILLYQPLLFVILGLTLVPAALLTYRVLRKRAYAVGNEIDALRPKSYGIIIDTFAGFIELKLANKLGQFRERVLVNQRTMQGLEAQAYLFNLLPVRVIEMVAILAIVTIFLYSLLFTDDPARLVTIIGLFAAAAYRLMPSVNRILTSLVTLKQHIYTFNTLAQWRAAQWQTASNAPQVPEITFAQSLTFADVTFAFPGTEAAVLSNLSFEVRKGEKIGFIGASGSGKTTLMNVLLRFYQQQGGQVLVDGQPLTPANLSAWHRLVGYVKQDTFLMEASLRDNITLGEENPDPDRLRYALENASLTDFVAGLPQGLDTVAGERGSRLSGGQRQRIGIARALYKQTQVMVLDEATSALDNETEREVNEAIAKLAHTDMTVLIIAHRITTLRECDRIYELAHGRIVRVHQYEELVASNV